ncbi:MAG: calcium-binding protein [Alphaproteobacteria bacterium]|nr:calcium-binding protein [Alphaproteobacteria bacterium]
MSSLTIGTFTDFRIGKGFPRNVLGYRYLEHGLFSMNLNVTYDTNTQSTAPAAFFSAVNYVVSLFESTFTNNVTVNIEIGYGNFPYDSSAVPALGESEQNGLTWADYGRVRQALLNEGAPGANTLSAAPPLSGGLVIDSAEAKALGLSGASSALDGWVGIASDTMLQQQANGSWSYSVAATPGGNQYDLVGVLEHEISEILGRTSYLDAPGEYGIMDLYRYASAGVRQTGTGGPAYFSTNGGVTNLGNWNTLPVGDLGDWAGSVGPDAFLAFSSAGQLNGFTARDLALMSSLGWTTGNTGANVFVDASGGNQVVVGTSTGNETVWGGAGDLILGGGGNETIGGAPGTTIIGGAAGNEFIDACRGNQSVVGGSGGNETIWGALSDTVTAGGGGSETIGGVFGETIIGSNGADVFIDATGGSESIAGGTAGNATVWTAAGDTVQGGTGNATIGGVAGVAMVGGAGGNQFLDASQGDQSIRGGSGGNETIWGAASDSITAGTGGNETIGGVFGETIGGSNGASVFINATAGSQSIAGGSGGNETVWSGAGDTIAAGSGNATIGGVAGDTIIGGAGNTFLDGTAGSQSILGGKGNSTVWGGARDTIQGASGGGSALIGLTGGNETLRDNGLTSTGYDTVTGFSEATGDRLSIANESAAAIDNVVASAQTSNGNTIISLPDGSIVTLVGVTHIDSSFFS